ncbi:a-pheromone processing metallopeptidase Ste23 [Aspergillus clavatus NRRL 1]|uniref:A-pheromone processing metallopeptidase Ste23 n=1 Tax=Aspergillus clavatus (strain ATCC 1007 / CBS 513.65 / DSM 816 / NCTC 3887 / NRRL 1 / QM 1276 / 107) TaxID=344612 RepID=A1C5E6_ASPCL|nr:a-pheromone processing metallopeptidase Ste23 [Aspergillus clavatus NRRL 1]EAW14914.1 a-pheromone processing metallopeptidase Ste23 [Aspergillus clavatus NRRL 1]
MPPRSSAALRLCYYRGLAYPGPRYFPSLSLVSTLASAAIAPPFSSSLRLRPICSLHPLPGSWTRRSFSRSACAPFSAGNLTMGSIEHLTESLEKPELDDRSYRVIRLPNKLEALLVHDPDTDKASASVNVNVGNFSDADDMPGMAHAVEHLLFMGTKKFPKENAYNQYLASHSGSSNAYTAATETNYFFEPSSPLYGALDRFAQFFVSPLFLESTLDRELRAVDSENKKNLQSDLWRLMQLNKSLSNPGHPYHHFSTGNLKTLKEDPEKRGLEVRSEFIKFYEKHYSANRMRLCVLGRESLDELEKWVEELFSEVENKDLPQNRWDDVQPWRPEDLGVQIFAKPVMDNRSLDIYFPFLDEEYLYESQPSRYISHLIGHEGPGSILAYIKAKGWANGLSAGVMPICPGSAAFTISIRLTKEGLQQYREVAKVVFEYIAMLKEREPQQWVFDEMKNLAEVEFRFKQKSPASRFTSRLSSVMQKPMPREWLLSGSLLRKFDPELIKKALACLQPDNFRMIVVSQEHPGDWDSKEKWYGTEYKVQKLPQDFMADIKNALATTPETRLSELHMPHENEFVPTRLSVEKKDISEPAKTPKLIRHDEHVRLWFKKDDRFWVPKGTVHITLRNPLAWATPANLVKSKLYCELVKDALVEYSYDAELAGLDYHLSASVFGLDISVGGYNDKMAVLLEKVLTSMRDLVVNPDRFHIIKERLSRGYRNAEYQQPFYQVGDYTRHLTAEKTWINEQYAAELEHIEPEDISNFFPQLLQQNHVEVLAHGNLYKEDALRMTDLVENVLQSRPLPQSQWHVRRNIIIPPGSNYVYERTLQDPANVNHCIEYYVYVGSIRDDILRAKLLLFAQMTDEPAFDQLRSKEQLGYVVWSGARYSATTIGYRVIIQSERTAEYLESRIDNFLIQAGETLENMSDKDFEGHKRSVVNKRLEKLKNLSSETSRFWSHIGSEYFDFVQNETDAANVRTLTKADIVDFYKQLIDPRSPTRGKLSIYLNAQAGGHTHTIDPKEQRSQLVSLFGKQLETAGFAVDTERFGSVFESVDVSAGNTEQILSVLKAFLTSEMSLSEQQVAPVLEQAKQNIGLHAKQLGIEAVDQDSKPLTNGTGKAQDKQKVTYITNVPDFKASLSMSAGPLAATDLTEFEDFDAKL